METYITGLEKVMRCYVQRLHWLLSGECDYSPERWEGPERKLIPETVRPVGLANRFSLY